MEMGDHHHHHQYGLPNLQRLLARRTQFPATLPQPSETYPGHRNMAPLAPYHEAFTDSNGMAIPSGLVRYGHDHFPAASATIEPNCAPAVLFEVEMENGGWSLKNMDGGNSRWPRQETLTLLHIRSKLDSKFKEGNHKGPLWDQVSRIMAEEHGYRRSGKKCREKFENLYKYYKKIKEGKAGGRDGKNYRFFRQLEALDGETSNQASVLETNLAQRAVLFGTPNNIMNQENHHQESTLHEQKTSESPSFFDLSEFETSSSENNDDYDDDLSAIAFRMKRSMEIKQKSGISSSRVKNRWEMKVKDIVEPQMKKLINAQDVWMERMLKKIEDKEQERLSKDEEWRRQETARFDKERELWVKKRASAKVRDAALMEFLNKSTGKGLEVSTSAEPLETQNQTSTSLEPSFLETSGYSKKTLYMGRNKSRNGEFGI
ncbi:hypothetical protein PTKIN_Ptkin01aG0273200 [Pterospermum kingtungense]